MLCLVAWGWIIFMGTDWLTDTNSCTKRTLQLCTWFHPFSRSWSRCPPSSFAFLHWAQKRAQSSKLQLLFWDGWTPQWYFTVTQSKSPTTEPTTEYNQHNFLRDTTDNESPFRKWDPTSRTESSCSELRGWGYSGPNGTLSQYENRKKESLFCSSFPRVEAGWILILEF